MRDAQTLQPDGAEKLRAIVSQVMSISDMTRGGRERYSVRFRGRLQIDPQQAFDRLTVEFRSLNHMPVFRKEEGQHVILAVPGVIEPRPSNSRVNLALFGLTLVSVLHTGAILAYDGPQIGELALLLYGLTHLLTGWPFAVGLLAILAAHEFGHYFAARWHNAPVTLPYFIPFPGSFFGTLGAVIRMKAPIRNRRVLLDIGVAGPLAGFVVAIPVLLIGLNLSDLGTIPSTDFLIEGNSIIYLLAKFVMFGKVLPQPASYGNLPPLLYWLVYFFTGQPSPAGGVDVIIHPVVWAGWAGLLVTGLNLIPAGQLDGGHTLYVLMGRRASTLVPVIIGVLFLMGFVWTGWWLWAALIFLFARWHAELLDEITPLNPARQLLALGTLFLFLLVLTPVPLTVF